MNKVIVYGNLVKEPDLRYTKDGKPVCNLTLAVEDGYGKYKDTQFLNAVTWNNVAEAIANNYSKGDPILIVGKIKIDINEKNGKKYKNVYIEAKEVKFIFRSIKNSDNYKKNNDKNNEEKDESDNKPEIEEDFDVPF